MAGQRNGSLPLIKLDHGKTYEGEWLDDKPHGRGIQICIFGRYEGDFKHGLPNGRGEWTCQGANGVFSWQYSGDFEMYAPTKGELVEADGRRFEVTYDKGCGFIYREPKPKTKKEIVVQSAGGPRGGGAAGGHGAGAVGGAHGGQAQLSSPGSGGVRVAVLAEVVGGGRKRKSVFKTLFSPRAKYARTGGAGGAGAEGACSKRGVYNKEEIEQHVNVLYRWEWRQPDGTYLAFDKGQSMEIETCFRQGIWGARLVVPRLPLCHGEERKYVVDFDDMTVLMGGDSWATAIRRWDRDVPMGESWDHQVDNMSIVDVEAGWMDYKVVETAFFDRKREDGKESCISRRKHTILSVRRVQNRRLFRQFEALRKDMQEQRGKDKVELTCTYAWHGSGKTIPDEIASGAGIMMQFGNSQSFYQQGSYSAEQASYSHNERYVYRSSDVEGRQQSDTGKYFHLLLVKVLRGNPLKTSEVWMGRDFGYAHGRLGQSFDSVEGGPHQPSKAGHGIDDSIIYVVYHPSQSLPEFIITYTEDAFVVD